MFRITVLVENASSSSALRAEHGLCFLIESDHGPAGLFDTGQSDALVVNAAAMGHALADVSWVVLSHGHYDHTGGLLPLLSRAGAVDLFAHPAAFEPKLVLESDGRWRDAGLPASKNQVESAGARLQLGAGPVAVADGIRTTGEIARTTTFETVSSRFFTRCNGHLQPDPFPDDQALLLESERGLVVLLGCAHAGVVNTLREVERQTDGAPVYALIGGMHLGQASPERIANTIDAVRRAGIRHVGLAHCTGEAATEYFFSKLGDRCFRCPVGTVIEY